MGTHQESGRVVSNDLPQKQPPAGGAAIVEDVLTLPEGQVVLRLPRELGKRSMGYLERWIALMVEKLKPEDPAATPSNGQK